MSLPKVSPSDSGIYFCAVGNPYGSTLSDNAVIVVKDPQLPPAQATTTTTVK